MALACAMISLVGISLLVGSSAPASAVPAPADYTTPTNNTNFFSNPLVLAGIGAVLVIANIALLVLMMMRRRRGGASTEEESEEEEEDEGEGSDDGMGDEGSGSEDEPPTGGSSDS